MRMLTPQLEKVVNATGALLNDPHPVRPNQLCKKISLAFM